MNRLVLSVAVLALQISSHAFAETYSYTGAKFTDVRGEYTTDMRVTGTIVTSKPIPPDVVQFDIRNILTSWSFHDGVQTIDNVNGLFDPDPTEGNPWVSTDNTGNIIQARLVMFLYPRGKDVGDVDSYIIIGYGIPRGWNQAMKDGVCNYLFEDYCTGYEKDNLAFVPGGIWVKRVPVPPIPTLSHLSLLLFTVLLFSIGIIRVSRTTEEVPENRTAL